MKCEKIEDLVLTDYIDGNLKGEALREVEAHLEACEKCRALADEAISAGKIFSAAGKEEAPAGVWRRIEDEIRPVREAPRLRYFFTHMRPAVVMATAAVIILFILTAPRIMPGRNTVTGGVTQDDILTITSLGDGQDEAESDFGTATEQYFL